MALPRANALSDRRGRRHPVAPVAAAGAQQPVVNVPLYSTGAAIRLTALLLGHILPVFSLATSNQPAAWPVSVRRRTRGKPPRACRKR